MTTAHEGSSSWRGRAVMPFPLSGRAVRSLGLQVVATTISATRTPVSSTACGCWPLSRAVRDRGGTGQTCRMSAKSAVAAVRGSISFSGHRTTTLKSCTTVIRNPRTTALATRCTTGPPRGSRGAAVPAGCCSRWPCPP